jgi:hypothetical protein
MGKVLSDIEVEANLLKEKLQPLLKAQFQSSRDAFLSHPDNTRKALAMLGQNGWYISLDMEISATYAVFRQLEEGKLKEVDESMCAFYEERLDAIKKQLIASFPHRSHVLERAFGAHQRGEYELSVPVFLSQADGICLELTDFQLYRRREGQPTTAGFVEQLAADSIIKVLLEPLRIPLPITASSKERKDYPYALNRHEILHGKAVDYGTRTNSYKAISLLHYVYSTLSHASARRHPSKVKTHTNGR